MMKPSETQAEGTAADQPAFSDDGVDLTLIRWMLSLSVEERIRHLQEHASFVQKLRDAKAKLELSEDT